MTTKNPFTNRIINYGTKPADQFQANPANYRTHPQKQRDAVQASLRELGWIGVVVENRQTGQLIDGHERVWQALANNEDVPYIEVDLSPEEERLALAIFDPITYMAETDAEILDALLREVNTGEAALQELLAEMAEDANLYLDEPNHTSDPGAQTDKAEELGTKWGTASGQIWQIAQHFVICGDCRESETWRRLLSAAGVDKVNGVFTSPPYAEQRKEQYGGTPADEYVAWWEAVQANVRANLASDGSFFVNIKPHCEDGERVLYVMDLVLAMRRQWGWKYVDELCWRKAKDGYPGGYPNRFRDAFEPIHHFSPEKKIKFAKWNVAHHSEASFKYSRGNKSENSTGSGFGLNGSGLETKEGLALPSNVLEIGEVNPDEAVSQAAMFPVALPDFFVRAYSDKGDVWLDPFLGSGTTIVAAHQNERVGLGIEFLPKYLGVILERLADATAREPVRVG